MSETRRLDMDLTINLDQDGFAIVPGVYSAQACENLAAELLKILSDCTDEATALKRHNGVIYGARNLLNVFPPARDIWRKQPLLDLLSAVLGSEFGLVRGLYFDKPPESNWSLPWHQDLTIALKNHSLPSQKFRNRTVKAGVPHVEAPDDILSQMLTLRIHLDAATDENGPLKVLPGTHIGRYATPPFRPPVTILASAGDVLAMRPLLSHSSGPSKSAGQHRRIIHLEFAAHPLLPDGYNWREFIPAKAL